MAHLPAATAFVHPTVEHVSVVHANPSLHDCVSPPPEQNPSRHVIAALKVIPEHDGAAHWIPSSKALQDVVLFADTQAWHQAAGLCTSFA
jgi:hypothetical protein